MPTAPTNEADVKIRLDPGQDKMWKDTIENCEKFMEPKRAEWNKLFKVYGLDYSDLATENPIGLTRMRQTVQKFIASLAFNYPHIFIKVLEEADNMPGNARASDIYQRAANETLELTHVGIQLSQAMFDAAFCVNGFIKVGYNPPGTDAEPPYTSSDWLQEDFLSARRISPYNILTDPDLAPHDMYEALYMIEKTMVPLDIARGMDRFEHVKDKIKPLGQDEQERENDQSANIVFPHTADMHTQPANEAEKKAIDESRRLKKMVMIHTVYDRMHRRRIYFVTGVDGAADVEPDPLLGHRPKFEVDGFGKRHLVSTEAGNGASYLVRGGFPFYRIHFDQNPEFWGPKSLMGYLKPLQDAQVHAMSRRIDILDMFKQIIAVNRKEVSNRPDGDLEKKVGELVDGRWLIMEDISNLKELSWGNMPADQYRIEQDLQKYESEAFDVTGESVGRSRTATGDALGASSAQLMREWYQKNIAGFYKWFTESAFSIFGDARYTPENFIVNVAEDGAPEMFEALKDYHFKSRMKITVEAGSMQPLIEQLEKDDTMALVGWLIGLPEVNRKSVIEMAIKAFRKDHDTLKILKDDANPDAAKLAEMEITQQFFAGLTPQVTQGEDHETHIRIQGVAAMQARADFQQMPQITGPGGFDPATGQPLPAPLTQQQVLQIAQAHEQMHMDMQAAETASVTSKAVANPESGPKTLTSAAQSIGNTVADAVKADSVDQVDQARG